VRRRAFITLLGSATAWPLAGRAQHERMRRIGVLFALAENDPESSRRLSALRAGLQDLGWSDGGNVRLDVRFGVGGPDRLREHARELVALAPDVIVSFGTAPLAPLQQATRNIPIVFALTSDPVGGGFVESLARPGGNATGFTLFEYSMSGKWVELLKEIAPRMTRAAALRDPSIPTGVGHFTAIQSLAPFLGVAVSAVNVRDAAEIERAVAAFAGSANGGLIVVPAPVTIVHRELIVALAVRYKLPAIYWDRFYVTEGGLISYGADTLDQCRRAAGYVDRILKGEKPADLPVQTAVKYELVINLKTAKALGLTVPETLLARADEVIE
jgi:putative ABC transport system substrate-binding protein